MSAEPLWLLAKNTFFLILVPGTVAFWAPLRWLTRTDLFALTWDAMTVAGLGAVLAGVAGLVWCVWHFGATGRGTPAPFDPPRRLVVRGLYRCVRNPMYVSAIVVVLGWALALKAGNVAWYAAVIWLFFHLFVVAVEEPILRGQFGEEYRRYTAAVGRWVPGSPWTPPQQR